MRRMERQDDPSWSNSSSNRSKWPSVGCVWFLQGAQSIEASIITPSLMAFIESLNGPQWMYGLSISLFWVGRLFALPVFGAWVDGREFKVAFCFATVMGVLGGLLYSMSSLLWIGLIPISRFLLGLSSGVASGIFAFIAKVSVGEETKYLGLTQMVFNVAAMIGPALASTFVYVPILSLHDRDILTPENLCGFFIAFLNLLGLQLFRNCFLEPKDIIASITASSSSSSSSSSTTRTTASVHANTPLLSAQEEEALQQQTDELEIMGEYNSLENSNDDNDDSDDDDIIDDDVDHELRARAFSSVSVKSIWETSKNMTTYLLESGAWVSFVLSFQNNFNQTVVRWSIPLISKENYEWGQKENGVVFAALGLIGFITTNFVVWFSTRCKVQDRKIILIFQQLVGLSMVLFLLNFGCNKNKDNAKLTTFALVLIIWGIGNYGQIPGNLGLFTKLVEGTQQGKFQALLFMVMAIARIIGGGILGITGRDNGPCIIWSVAVLLWVFQMLCFLPRYRRFHLRPR